MINEMITQQLQWPTIKHSRRSAKSFRHAYRGGKEGTKDAAGPGRHGSAPVTRSPPHPASKQSIRAMA
jgi:hypothetical protein